MAATGSMGRGGVLLSSPSTVVTPDREECGQGVQQTVRKNGTHRRHSLKRCLQDTHSSLSLSSTQFTKYFSLRASACAADDIHVAAPVRKMLFEKCILTPHQRMHLRGGSEGTRNGVYLIPEALICVATGLRRSSI